MKSAKRIFSILMVILLTLSLSQLVNATSLVEPDTPYDPNDFPLQTSYDDLYLFQQYLDEECDNLPSDFVLPEDLQSIGTFAGWLDQSFTVRNPPFSRYHYYIKLFEDNTILWLHVYHYGRYKTYFTQEELDISHVEGDMSKLNNAVNPNAHNYYILRDSIEYHYDDEGKLSSIQWHNLDNTSNTRTTYQLLLSISYKDYTVYNSGPFMDKLLSLDQEKFNEAQDILLSLGTSEGSKSEDSPGTGDPILLFAALLPTSAAGMALLHKKKKHI